LLTNSYLRFHAINLPTLVVQEIERGGVNVLVAQKLTSGEIFLVAKNIRFLGDSSRRDSKVDRGMVAF